MRRGQTACFITHSGSTFPVENSLIALRRKGKFALKKGPNLSKRSPTAARSAAFKTGDGFVSSAAKMVSAAASMGAVELDEMALNMFFMPATNAFVFITVQPQAI